MTARFFKTATELNFYMCWVLFVINLLSENQADKYFVPCILVLMGALLLNLSDATFIGNNTISLALRICGCALPSLAFLFVALKLAVVLVLLPWCYYCFVYFTNRQETSYDYFIKEFKFLSWSFLLMLILACFIKDKNLFGLLIASATWILMFAVSGFLEAQALRWRGSTQGKEAFEKKQIIDLSLFTGLAIILSMTDFFLKAEEFLYYKILLPVISLIIGFFFMGSAEAVTKLGELIPTLGDDRTEEYKEAAESAITTESNWAQGAEELFANAAPPAENAHFTVNPFVIIITAAILLLIIILGTKKKKRKLRVVSETHEILEIPKEKKVKKRKTDADTVRTLYTKHMRKISKVKNLPVSDTTLDIDKKGVKTDLVSAEDSKLIRDSYRKARYNDTSDSNDIKKLKKLIK
ncbi:MAG: hypothetical protein MJ113_02940 [Lachnospiraceae bacterium]|nr:hypothetical protein [Lachnospiraceae bacterium]